MELLNEWSPNGKFRKVDKPFLTDSTHEKVIMAVVPSTINALLKAEAEYYARF